LVDHKDLALSKKLLFSFGITVLLGLLGFAALEVYVRVTRPHLDVYALTGRTLGPNTKHEWAFIDAYAAFRPKPGAYS